MIKYDTNIRKQWQHNKTGCLMKQTNKNGTIDLHIAVPEKNWAA